MNVDNQIDDATMSRRMLVKATSIGSLSIDVHEDKNVKTVHAIWNALPIEGTVNRWGDEIYFSTSVHAPIEHAQETVEVGDVGYWPPGKAICLFFGRTPVSTDDKPRAASPVNVIGKIIGDPSLLRKVPEGQKIVIDRQN